MAKKPSGNAGAARPDGVRVTAAKCVRCKQAVAPRFRPFCSQRCTDLDLAGWLTSSYRIPTDETDDGTELNVPMDED